MIEMSNKVIDPKVLMERVRKNVLNKNGSEYETNIEVYSNINLNELKNDIDALYMNIQYLNERYKINDFTIKSHRKIVGPVIVFCKRFIRKMLYWFIRPYWEEQIKFNEAARNAIEDIAKIQSNLVNSIKDKN